MRPMCWRATARRVRRSCGIISDSQIDQFAQAAGHGRRIGACRSSLYGDPQRAFAEVSARPLISWPASTATQLADAI